MGCHASKARCDDPTGREAPSPAPGQTVISVDPALGKESEKEELSDEWFRALFSDGKAPAITCEAAKSSESREQPQQQSGAGSEQGNSVTSPCAMSHMRTDSQKSQKTRTSALESRAGSTCSTVYSSCASCEGSRKVVLRIPSIQRREYILEESKRYQYQRARETNGLQCKSHSDSSRQDKKNLPTLLASRVTSEKKVAERAKEKLRSGAISRPDDTVNGSKSSNVTFSQTRSSGQGSQPPVRNVASSGSLKSHSAQLSFGKANTDPGLSSAKSPTILSMLGSKVSAKVSRISLPIGAAAGQKGGVFLDFGGPWECHLLDVHGNAVHSDRYKVGDKLRNLEVIYVDVDKHIIEVVHGDGATESSTNPSAA